MTWFGNESNDTRKDRQTRTGAGQRVFRTRGPACGRKRSRSVPPPGSPEHFHGAGLLRHPDTMLTVASFRTWRGSHQPAAQGQPPAAENVRLSLARQEPK